MKVKTSRVVDLFLLIILVVLFFLAIPADDTAINKGAASSPLSNAKHIHLSVYNMASDRVTTGDKTIGWPGDCNIHTVQELATTLVAGSYMKESELKEFSCGGIPPVTSTSMISATRGNAFRFTRPQESDPGNTIFLISRNWNGTLRSGTTIINGGLTYDPPFQKKGVIVFRKGGDGAIISGPDFNQETLGTCPKNSTEFLK